MRKTVEVVDGFYADPMSVRESALRHTWHVAGGEDVPAGSTWAADAHAEPATVDRIAVLLGSPDRAAWGGIVRSGFAVFEESELVPAVTTLCRAGWGALIWLSPPDACRGGVSFCRPRTGPEAGDCHDWEETMLVPARFNRLVLFASDLPYRCTGFGQGPQTGSLVEFLLVEPLSAR